MSLALVYIRQSVHGRYERTASPEIQREACLSLPAVKACDEITFYEDLDVSGGKLKGRKRFLAMLERIKAGGVSTVAVYDQSRSFRSTWDALEFRAFMNERPEVTVAAAIGVPWDRSPVGTFNYTALAAAHQMEREMTAEKMRAARHYASAQGLAVGSIPAGYKWDGDGKDRRLVIDEPVAAIVRRVFEEYASGKSGLTIARRLNAEGLRLPTMTADGWRWSHVNAILRNVAYHGQTYTVSRDRREGELIDATWPAIVDDALWASVAAVRRSQRRGPGRGERARAYVFRGLLRCSCGLRLQAIATGPKGGREYRYYQHRPDGLFGHDCQDPRNVREEALLPWAREVFARLDTRRPPDFAARVKAREGNKRRSQPDALASVDATIARLGKRYEWGHIADADYQAEWERLQGLRAELLASERAPETDGLAVELSGALAMWDAAADEPGIRRQMLTTLFEELDFEAGRITGYRPRQDRAARVHELMSAAFGDEAVARFA